MSKVNGYHTSPTVNGDVKSEPHHQEEDIIPSPQGIQEFSIQEGYGKAKYTFKAESENELSFKKVSILLWGKW